MIRWNLTIRTYKYLDFLLYYFNLEEKEWEAYQAHKRKKKEEKEVDWTSNQRKRKVWLWQ